MVIDQSELILNYREPPFFSSWLLTDTRATEFALTVGVGVRREVGYGICSMGTIDIMGMIHDCTLVVFLLCHTQYTLLPETKREMVCKYSKDRDKICTLSPSKVPYPTTPCADNDDDVNQILPEEGKVYPSLPMYRIAYSCHIIVRPRSYCMIVNCCVGRSASNHCVFSAIQARLFSTPPPSDSTNKDSTHTTIATTKTPNHPASNATDLVTTERSEDYGLVQDIAQRGKSIMNAFFHETSKRSQRQRARRLAAARRRRKNAAAAASKNKDDDEEEEWVDTRTVRQILFPHPSDLLDDPDKEKRKGKRTPLKVYFQAFGKAWTMYKATWRGFWTRGLIVRDPVDEDLDGNKYPNDTKDTASEKSEADKTANNEKEEEEEESDEVISSTEAKKRLRRNVRRNAKVLRKTALRFREEVRERTGIKSAEDFRRVATDVMTLVSICLQEFLSGYREGRDSQVRKMLEEDLKQQQKEQAKAAAGGKDDEDDVDAEKPPRKRRRSIRRRALRRVVY